MDENTTKFTPKTNIIIFIVALILSIIIAFSLVNCLTHKDYEYSVDKYYTITDDGTTAIADIRVINNSNKEYTFSVTLNAYNVSTESWVGTGGGYIIASPNSNEIYSFIVTSFSQTNNLFNSYIKLEHFREVNV